MLSRSSNLFATFVKECSYTNIPLMSRRTKLCIDLLKIPGAYAAAANYKTCNPSSSCGSSGSKIQIKYKPYKEVKWIDHDYKNMVDYRRPMSPHMTIYGPTYTSITSIFQRITGIIVACYTFALAYSVLFIKGGPGTIVKMIQNLELPEVAIIGIKFVIAIIFLFHYFNGIRFCMFNLGKLLDLPYAKSSAYLMTLSTVFTAVITALIGHYYQLYIY